MLSDGIRSGTAPAATGPCGAGAATPRMFARLVAGAPSSKSGVADAGSAFGSEVSAGSAILPTSGVASADPSARVVVSPVVSAEPSVDWKRAPGFARTVSTDRVGDRLPDRIGPGAASAAIGPCDAGAATAGTLAVLAVGAASPRPFVTGSRSAFVADASSTFVASADADAAVPSDFVAPPGVDRRSSHRPVPVREACIAAGVKERARAVTCVGPPVPFASAPGVPEVVAASRPAKVSARLASPASLSAAAAASPLGATPPAGGRAASIAWVTAVRLRSKPACAVPASAERAPRTVERPEDRDAASVKSAVPTAMHRSCPTRSASRRPEPEIMQALARTR